MVNTALSLFQLVQGQHFRSIAQKYISILQTWNSLHRSTWEMFNLAKNLLNDKATLTQKLSETSKAQSQLEQEIHTMEAELPHLSVIRNGIPNQVDFVRQKGAQLIESQLKSHMDHVLVKRRHQLIPTLIFDAFLEFDLPLNQYAIQVLGDQTSEPTLTTLLQGFPCALSVITASYKNGSLQKVDNQSCLTQKAEEYSVTIESHNIVYDEKLFMLSSTALLDFERKFKESTAAHLDIIATNLQSYLNTFYDLVISQVKHAITEKKKAEQNFIAAITAIARDITINSEKEQKVKKHGTEMLAESAKKLEKLRSAYNLILSAAAPSIYKYLWQKDADACL